MASTNSYAAFVAPRRDALLSAASAAGSMAATSGPNGATSDQKGPLIMSAITTKDSTEIYYKDYR
jgi:hypothetical protein